MKILHLPTSVGGNSWGLAQAEKALGLQADTLYLSENWVRYPGNYILDHSGRVPLSFPAGVLGALRIPKKYDVLHFNFGSSLIDLPDLGINLWDLCFYKKQKLFVTYNGCDARQKHLRAAQTALSACADKQCLGGLCALARADEIKQKRIRKFAKAGASFFAVNPDIMNFLPERTIFLPYAIANWDEIKQHDILQDKGTITIVHAPTNRVCKGSKAILDAVQALQTKYPDKINLLLVENASHAKALQIYARADLIIDQVRIGWYGAFAVEAMKMGKPVMVYINEEDLHFIPKKMAQECIEAFFCANEYTIQTELEKIVQNPILLTQKREAAMEYVYRWHTPLQVAQITKAAYEKAFGDD